MSNSVTRVTDPFEYLKDDHKKVAALLEKIINTTERDELFSELKEVLTLHADMEEAIVYPALEELDETHDLALEAVEEHAIVRTTLEELAEGDKGSDEWNAKITVLKENIEHHVKEEEGEMFKKARVAMTKDQLDEMAEEMNEFLEDEA